MAAVIVHAALSAAGRFAAVVHVTKEKAGDCWEGAWCKLGSWEGLQKMPCLVYLGY